MNRFAPLRRPLMLTALLASLLPGLQGCFPVVATGVAVGVMSATDRRTLGAQTEDETIEWKASGRISEKFKDRAHINITSYNRKVLISGEAPNADAKAEIGELARTTTNVQAIYNEAVVSPVSPLGARSNDSYITSKLKARLVDNKQVSANHIKVVTEGGIAFLMGIVNDREAKAAVYVARTTDGVRKVVNLLEVVSEAETRRLDAMTSEQKKQEAGQAPVEARR